MTFANEARVASYNSVAKSYALLSYLFYFNVSQVILHIAHHGNNCISRMAWWKTVMYSNQLSSLFIIKSSKQKVNYVFTASARLCAKNVTFVLYFDTSLWLHCITSTVILKKVFTRASYYEHCYCRLKRVTAVFRSMRLIFTSHFAQKRLDNGIVWRELQPEIIWN